MRLMRVHVSLCVILLVSLTIAEGRTRQRSQSAFRTGVDVVEVPVTVLDGKRQPVQGLRAEDFTILEDGKSRPVVAFAAVHVSTSAGVPRTPEAATDLVPVSGAEGQTRDGRVVVIVLDRSIPFGAPTQIAQLMARSVVQSMAPNDLGAVVYTGSTQRSQDLTGDSARLLAAIGSTEPNSADSPGVTFRDGIEHDRLEAQLWHDDRVPRLMPDFDLSGECMCGLCVLEAITHIAKTLEQLPRRTKSLVFIGLDLNLETRQVQCTGKVRDARRNLFRALDDSSLTVHTIDASGLETRLIPASSTVQGRDLLQPISPAPGSLGVIDRASQKDLARQGNLAVLPDRTGGRFVVHTNDPHLLAGDIIRESSTFYVMAFEPAGAPDGKTHQIRVKVNRSSVDVHTRRVYVRE